MDYHLKEEKTDVDEVCGNSKLEQRLFVCAECKTVFTAEQELDEHLKNHTHGEVVPETSFPNSTVCTVKTEMELKEEKVDLCHIYHKPKPEPFTAMAMNTDDTLFSDVNRQIKQEEQSPERIEFVETPKTDKRLNLCNLCNQALTDSEITHDKDCTDTPKVLIDIGNKSHVCNSCHKTFSEKDVPASYGKQCGFPVDLEWKAYKCNQCDKAFAEKHQLTRHLRVHSGEKAL